MWILSSRDNAHPYVQMREYPGISPLLLNIKHMLSTHYVSPLNEALHVLTDS